MTTSLTRLLIPACAIAVLAMTGLSAPALATVTSNYPPVTQTQSPAGAPTMVGQAAWREPVAAPFDYQPVVSFLHANGGNTDSFPYPGPLGDDLSSGSAAAPLTAPFMWGTDGSLTAGCILPNGAFCLAVVDPTTLAVEAQWSPPPGQTLELAYAVEDQQGEIYVPTKQGDIFELQRRGSGSGVSLSETGEPIDLSSDLAPSQEVLLDVMPDSRGNVWFTTGGILKNAPVAATTMTYGYVTPQGTVVQKQIAGQIDENGIAVNGTNMYMDTGPLQSDDHAASGYVYDLTSNPPDTGLETVWSASYDAGSEVKPGGFARGSGSSPTLIGDRYLAITDNDDTQEHALIYRLGAGVSGQSRLVCAEPIFPAGQGAVDIAGITEENGDDDSVVLANDYNAPPDGDPTLEGMAPGFVRVQVNSDGSGCHLAWNDPNVRLTTVPIMSTATGLIYTYTEDRPLALEGTDVWYFTAISYRTGQVLWRRLAGSGTDFNDDYAPLTLSPTGNLFQILPTGVAWVYDAGSW